MKSNEAEHIHTEESVTQSNADQSKQRKKSFRMLLMILAASLFILFIAVLIFYFTSTSSGKKEVYYQADFSESMEEWEGDDAEWQGSFDGKDGLLTLTKENMMAPHSMSTLPAEKVKADSFAFHTSFHLSAFTGQATTLSTLVFPTTSLSVVVNDEGKLGIARDLFQQPAYSEHIASDIELNTWENLYIYIDGKEESMQVYLGDRQVIEEKFEEPSFPLQEVWLGSIWLEGSGNYGAANRLAFDQVEIGNEFLLPQPTFLSFVTALMLDWISAVKNLIAAILP